MLSFIPHLQKPPTHTQTGSAPVSVNPSTMNLSTDDEDKARPVTTNPITDPYGPRRWVSQMVELSGKNRALNEFSVERIGEDVEENLVMLHGYGAGLGFFYKNFEALSRAPGWRLYALDMLGMGRSTRPPFKIHAKTREDQITEAENWFIDALEEWRIKRNIERFTLCGHSLGGYMAVAYALKYPGHLNKLILASPVGIPEDPYAMNADMPEQVESTMGNEFTQDQEATTNDNNNFMNARTHPGPPTGRLGDPKAPRRPLPKWLTYLWDQNISPFSIVRWSGPLGPRLVSGWTSRRFSHLPPEESKALHDYSYSLFRQRGSGEYALAYVLAPGAFARSPLIRRIQGVGRQYIGAHAGPIPDTDAGITAPSPSASPTITSTSTASAQSPVAQHAKLREHGIPIVFMYGDHDWMDVNGGYAAAKILNSETQRQLQNATPEERKRDRGSAKVVVIRNAGHHVYLDGADEFNEVMLEEMKEVSRTETVRKALEAARREGSAE